MTEDQCPRASSAASAASTNSSTTKQRKKRKWDQPAESVAGIFPLGNMGSFSGVPFPGVPPASVAFLKNPLTAGSADLPQMFQMPAKQQHAAALVQKLNQPKIQDELIAREIVINDADSAVRYKLTKRQTQEEIQNCTGAVVITRGKYRPPNAPADGEKPLYLHISAGAHLDTTVERIKAVDRAAAMVEEMLKNGSLNNGVKVGQLLSACVYLGFDADPSLNIVARIRGPNGQYVNHIMNETGATLLLRGRGSGNVESEQGEEGQQPLHLFLSSSNVKSLEKAKLLAENLLDTISAECGASRVSPCKVYGAVPPPLQLSAGVLSSGNELKDNSITDERRLTSSSAVSAPVPAVSSFTAPGVPTTFTQVPPPHVGLVIGGQSHPHITSYSQPSLTGGTSYSGYGGIFPQATPLQQVALVLRQSTSQATAIVAPPTTAAIAVSNSSKSSPSEKERQPPQRRKFQELPVSSKEPAKVHQVFSLTLYEANRPILDLCWTFVCFTGFSVMEVAWNLGSEFRKPRQPTPDFGIRNVSNMPPPKKLVQSSTNGMPPPLARVMPPPPPPPKFNSSVPPISKPHENRNSINRPKAETVPDTLVKLMEYGDEDEDDDLEETSEGLAKGKSNTPAAPKPFWAV